MKLPAVLTPPSIYHSCSTWKTLWEVKFTPGEFTPVNMENCGRHNVRKHGEIKNGEKYITLDLSLKFSSLDKMKIIFLDPKDYLGRSGKGLITSLGLNTIGRSKKKKKKRYASTNVSMKYLSKIIKDFEKFPYEGYVQKRPKHEPTDSYIFSKNTSC